MKAITRRCLSVLLAMMLLLSLGAAALASAADAETALGELLFAAVAVAREQGVDAEMALHGACERAIDAVKAREGR